MMELSKNSSTMEKYQTKFPNQQNYDGKVSNKARKI